MKIKEEKKRYKFYMQVLVRYEKKEIG